MKKHNIDIAQGEQVKEKWIHKVYREIHGLRNIIVSKVTPTQNDRIMFFLIDRL